MVWPKGAYNAVRGNVSLEKVLLEAIRSGKEELARTPELLPALKAAGVVDAGGQGLIVFFEGCLAGLRGQDCEVLPVTPRAKVQIQKGEPLDLEYPYCTEFIVKDADVDKQTVSKALEGMGNSMIVAVVEDIVKVHIHTKHPGDALNMAQTWGTLHDIKIENMRDQHENRLFTAEDIQPVKHGVGVLTVAAGDGIAKIMHEMGAAEIISGGQSMNPPVEEFVNAIENGTCEQYIILPNNKNIVLAANQARDLTEDKEIVVVPTKTIPQGITAMISYVPEKNSAENTEAMLQAIEHVKTGQITYAVRDTRIDDKEIHEGDMMGIGDHGILAVGKDRMEVAKETVAQMVDDESEVISIYYGADTEEAEAEELATALEEAYPDCDVELNAGGQPIYYYVISVE